MPPRRTEHCWPVARTLDDLADVALDPSSTEAGSFHVVKRLMEPDIHRQFLLQTAKRFRAAGWTVFVAVFSVHRAVAINEGLIADAEALGQPSETFEPDPLMSDHCVKRQQIKSVPAGDSSDAGTFLVYGNRLADKVASGMAMAEGGTEEGRVLVICEKMGSVGKVGLDVDAQSAVPAVLAVSAPVRTVDPVQCPRCAEQGVLTQVFVNEHRVQGLHHRCRASRHPYWTAPATVPAKGDEAPIKLSDTRRWTELESLAAQELRSEGLTYAQIGERLDRSWRAVRDHLRTGGYAGTKARQKMRQGLQRLMAQAEAQA